MRRRGGGRGGDPDARRARRAGDRRRRRLRATRSRRDAGRTSTRRTRVLAASRPTAVNLALGARRDARRPDARARARGSTTTRSSAAARWARTPPTLVRARHARAHALQHRRPRDRRLRHGGRRDPGRVRSRGCVEHVWVDETRPLLQGARLTAWELEALGIPHAVIVDCGRGVADGRRRGRLRVTGADRIAANGDTANKIGTYGLAVLAAPSRDPVLRRRADLDDRPRDADRRGDPDRGARRRRGDRRASRRATRPSTSRRPALSRRS